MIRKWRKIAGIVLLALTLYTVLYCFSVETVYELSKAGYVPVPQYRPWDCFVLQVVFAPANIIDATYFRRARWEDIQQEVPRDKVTGWAKEAQQRAAPLPRAPQPGHSEGAP